MVRRVDTDYLQLMEFLAHRLEITFSDVLMPGSTIVSFDRDLTTLENIFVLRGRNNYGEEVGYTVRISQLVVSSAIDLDTYIERSLAAMFSSVLAEERSRMRARRYLSDRPPLAETLATWSSRGTPQARTLRLGKDIRKGVKGTKKQARRKIRIPT